MTEPTKSLKPFWRYYGGKWRAAPRYPKPRHRRIIEPFAGAAGYACRYPDHDVVLVDKYPVVCEIWRYLISADPAEIRATPADIDHVDELPDWVPPGLRSLVGFAMNAAVVAPRKKLSAGRRKLRAQGCAFEGWSPQLIERVASQVPRIRHWTIIEGDWWDAPDDARATWYVDPPYNNKAGSYYVYGPDAIDFDLLAQGCRLMPGQVIVCENAGADWLPFEPFATLKAGINNTTGGSREVIWTADNP